MAVTSIWRVKGWLGKVVLYIENPEKTKDPDFYQREGLAGQERESLADVIAYAVDQEKTRRKDWGSDTLDDEHEQILQQYVSGINCATSTARMEMLAVKKRFGKLEHEKERMVGERRHLQYQCRSIRDPERMAQVKREIKELNGKIGENRRKIKLCQGIGERSGLMRKKIRIVHQEKNREKEVQRYEYIGRGG